MPSDVPSNEQPAPAAPAGLTIVIDDRERASGLPEAVLAAWPSVAVGRLAIGDIEIGDRILVERKTVADLVASLGDGRLFRQMYALSAAAARPLLIVEGRDGAPLVDLSPASLRGALLAIAVGFRIPLLRTDDVQETAAFLAHLARQEERRRSARRGAGRGSAGTSRSAEHPQARVAAELLGAIPGVGDLRARRLLDRFGDPASTLAADEQELRDVPGIGPRTARSIADAARG